MLYLQVCGDEKKKPFLTLSYGIHPVCLDDETRSFTDMAMLFLTRAGMVEKDEEVMESESTRDVQETDSLEIISV